MRDKARLRNIFAVRGRRRSQAQSAVILDG
jgi:hypothetical protein